MKLRWRMSTYRSCGFFAIMLVCASWLTLPVLAAAEKAAISSPARKDKAIAMVKAVHAYVSRHGEDMAAVQKALETDPRFRDDENQLYIFMHAYDFQKKEAICIAQGIRPELVGKNMWRLRTPNGRLLFQEEVALVEQKDEFWLEYEWLNPYTKTIQTKQSFFKKIILKDGRNAWIGCGFWKE